MCEVIQTRASELVNRIHRLGVYHRDLIAADIYWNGSTVWIADFGHAAFMAENLPAGFISNYLHNCSNFFIVSKKLASSESCMSSF